MPRILMLGPAWLGDMIMAQSLFKSVKAKQPQAQIDLLAPPWSLLVGQRMREIKNCYPIDIGHGELKLKKRYDIAKPLRHKYDQAFVCPNSFKSALIPWFAGIPKRTGWLGECRYGLLNDYRKLDKKRYPQTVQRCAALAYADGEQLSDVPFPSLSVDKKNLDKLIKHYNLSLDKPIVAISPGAEYGPSKRWPTLAFSELATRLLAGGVNVWIFGSPKELKLGEEIQMQTNNRCVNFVGQTSLPDVIDLMSLASNAVCNDSGLMHLAAATGVPVTAILVALIILLLHL